MSRRALLAGAVGLLAAACGGDDDSGERSTPVATRVVGAFPIDELLVDVDWLSARIDDPDLRLIDCSALPEYRDGHIPGARHIWWQDTIEVNNPVYGMIVGRIGRDPIVRAAGISPRSTVVAYDRDGGTYAARLIWMLQFDGFFGGRLLDGGLQSWSAAGGDLTLEEPSDGSGGLDGGANEEILAHAHDIAARLGDQGLVILDTRTESERRETWNGRLRHGAISGSVWFPRDRFFAAGSVPYLLAPDVLQARLADAGITGDLLQAERIVYGLHGTLASLPWLALTGLGGGNVRVYDGSWSEWGADPELPIEPLPD